jgi:hypothetical protein
VVHLHLAAQDLEQARDDPVAHLEVAGGLEDALRHKGRGGRGDDQLGDAVPPHERRHLIDRAEHRQAGDPPPPLRRVIVREADRDEPDLGVALELPGDHRARLARPDDQGRPAGRGPELRAIRAS